MPLPLEGYGLIGDTQAAALVGRDGSIDWLCLPRFDSAACFAALLGDERHGRFLIAPADRDARVSRRYKPGTLVLETEFTTRDGVVRLVDCMPPREHDPDIVRVVKGVSGRVPMRMELVVRFEYGSVVPWVRRHGSALSAIGGPDGVCLHTPVPTHGEDLTTIAEFSVAAGERVPFVLAWHPSHEPPPRGLDPLGALRHTESWWAEWASDCTYEGGWPDAVGTSCRALKALTYAPTGGIVAAPTTSLPEELGGTRNWDYRYCWLRDAALTLHSLIVVGYLDEARAWRDWLLRAIAGEPRAIQVLYGPAGERRLPELELEWLPGYEGARPVRIGNGAAGQQQLDVFGELLDAMHQARQTGFQPPPEAWDLISLLLEFLESDWGQPDHGIWEMRGPRRHFTHSKVMAWVAFDRAVMALEQTGLDGPLDRWRRARAEIHAEVCREGYDPERNTFTQSYGSQELDASLLLIPIVGFLPASDPRVAGTVEAIQRELCEDGFVYRYRAGEIEHVDALPGREGAFLPCSFWMVDNLALMGRREEAQTLFEKLLAVRNDLGLLAEEYDPQAGRLVGNFPQAFSHVGLVNSAWNLSRPGGPRSERQPP